MTTDEEKVIIIGKIEKYISGGIIDDYGRDSAFMLWTLGEMFIARYAFIRGIDLDEFLPKIKHNIELFRDDLKNPDCKDRV